MKRLAAYLKGRWAWYAVVISLYTATALVFWLHDLAWHDFEDVVLISLMPVLVIGVIDGSLYLHTLALGARLKNENAATMPLPEVSEPAAAEFCQALTLLQRQLAEQKRQEAAQMQAQTETLQLWSHQIKTPLTGLDMLLQVQPLAVPAARKEVGQINRYLTMLLAYLKLADVNTDLVLTTLQLTPLVQRKVRELAPLFIEKDLTVKVDALPSVVGDTQWLAFIIEQVLTNAIKYTPQGTIHVSWQQNALVIADTGIGIAAADLPRVFERGYSGVNGRASHTASGLGLYLSRTIAEKMGLTMTLTSQVGQGTQVALHFPPQTFLSKL